MPEIRDEFHHIIPRLILRGFLAEPQPDDYEVRRAKSLENGGRREEKKKKKKKRCKRKKSVTSQAQESEGEAKGDDGGSSVDEEGGPIGSDQTGVEPETPKREATEDTGALEPKGDIRGEPEAIQPKLGPEEGVEAEKPVGDSGEDCGPSPKPTSKEGKGKPRKPNASYGRNGYIKVYDLKTGVLDYHRIGEVYGGVGIYLDLHHEKKDHIERELSHLEGEASAIINMVKGSRGDGTCEFSLTQKNWNILRKFLFLMRYRGSEFRAKYTPKIEEYTHNDREMLIKFMAEKGITEPLQVWLLNIVAILKTEIDRDGQWVETVNREMFGIDAANYISHMKESSIAFCEPSSPDDEFIITDNAFDIFEGPVTYGLADPEDDAQYHKLAPLERRLMLVLRPNPVTPTAPWDIPGRLGGESKLKDIPIGPLANANPEDSEGSSPSKIFKISTEQVHLINSILLHEVAESISFVSNTALKRTLRAFLANPSFMLDRSLAMSPEFETRLAKRCKKEWLLGLVDRPYRAGGIGPPEGLQNVDENLRSYEELQGYFRLGGTPEMFWYDSHQALLITEMRSYAAQNNRELVPPRSLINGTTLGLMATLSSRIVWIHLKFWKIGAEKARKGFQTDPEGVINAGVPLETGPEDIVTKLAEYLPPGNLSKLMLEASLKHNRRIHNEETMESHRVSESGRANARLVEDREMFEQWGGLKDSFFSEDTPFHNASIGYREPFRKPPPKEMLHELYEEDLSARRELRGRLEDKVLNGRGAPDSYEWLGQLLWHHLYPLPPDSILVEEQHGSHAKLPC